MTRLRVTHVIHDTRCGGTEMMLYKLLYALRNRYDFSVLSLMGRREMGERIEALGVPVIPIHLAESGKAKPWRIHRIVSELRQLQPHVVQTWGYHADLVGGIAAKLGTRASIVWNIRHATLDPQLDSKNVLRSAQLCGKISKWVPDRILLNAEAAISVHQQAGYAGDKMQVIPNGFDTERFSPQAEVAALIRKELSFATDTPIVGMCGRFHPHKGQQQFVQTADRIAKSRSDIQFVMVGRGCDQENQELVSWIKQAGIGNRLRLLGERSDMPAVLNAMDLLLLPSLTEGLPNIVGEAMACGVPVISTDVGDASRLLDGCGTLVAPNDASAMANATLQFFEKPKAERQELGTQSRQRIQTHFELSVVAEQYATVWQETLQRKQAAGKTVVAEHSEPKKPKLVHVTTIPYTQWLFLRGQLGFMAQQGFEVHSVSSPGDYLDRIQQRDPVVTHGVPISRQIQPLRDALSLYRLFRLFRQLRPEITQLSTPKAALLGAIAAKLAGVPVRIYQVRGLSSESELGWKRWMYQRLERLTANLCNANLVNAKSLLRYAQEAKILDGGVVAGRGMSNGIDLVRFDPARITSQDLTSWDPHWQAPTCGPVIGFVGRLTRDKGVEDIEQAWRALGNDFPRARLLLVGPWESENSVAREVRNRMEADPRIILPGRQDDVASFYSCMDVFVYPSHGTEGFPNAPMEAAAMELPVITTRVVGCVDAVIHGQTGSLISPQAPGELEAELRRYLSQPLLRKRHGRAGRERIRDGFSPETLWTAFEDYYMHLLRRENCPVPQRTTGIRRRAA